MNDLKNPLLPICYFPTTTLMIDDNVNQLRSLSAELDRNHTVPKLYENPYSVLDFLKKEYIPGLTLETYLSLSNDSPADSQHIKIDIKKIRNLINNPKRFSEIAGIIVDYNMPGINGVDFSRLLGKTLVKIMMLTGVADQELAVKAFNENLINQFIRKDESNFHNVFNKAIKEAQLNYFIETQKIAIDSLLASNFATNIADNLFVELFEKICCDNQILEFYLTDNHGSFLLLDKNANPKWLAVKTEEDLEEQIEYLDEYEAPDHIINALKQRKKIPYFYNEEDFLTAPEEWGRYLFPATRLDAKQTYYYSVITTHNHPFNFKKNNVMSYKEFLNVNSQDAF